MHSCHSILECYNLFSGVDLSIRSFGFIYLAVPVQVSYEEGIYKKKMISSLDL